MSADYMKARYQELAELWKEAEQIFHKQMAPVDVQVDAAGLLPGGTKLAWQKRTGEPCFFHLCMVTRDGQAVPILQTSIEERIILSKFLSELYLKCQEESQNKTKRIVDAIEVLKATIKEYKRG